LHHVSKPYSLSILFKPSEPDDGDDTSCFRYIGILPPTTGFRSGFSLPTKLPKNVYLKMTTYWEIRGEGGDRPRETAAWRASWRRDRVGSGYRMPRRTKASDPLHGSGRRPGNNESFEEKGNRNRRASNRVEVILCYNAILLEKEVEEE
jgi:hypothetical protein